MLNDHEYDMEVGSRIRIARLSAGLSQDELAKKVGYSNRSAISKLEAGVTTLDLKYVDLLASALDVTVSWIIGYESEPVTPVGVTADELIIIEKYDMLNDSMQKRLLAYMDKLLELQKMEDEI